MRKQDVANGRMSICLPCGPAGDKKRNLILVDNPAKLYGF